MPQLMPFRGLRYTAAAGPLSDLLAPPYDVISPSQKAALDSRSPYNAIHLEFSNAGADPYATVAGELHDWEANGVLARDPAPMLYVYEQRFTERGAHCLRGGRSSPPSRPSHGKRERSNRTSSRCLVRKRIASSC